MDMILKNKNKDILTFSINKIKQNIKDKDVDLYTMELNINEIKNKELIPYGMTETNDSLKNWLLQRKIPKNRAYVDEILESISEQDNPFKYIEVSYGLSLNDSYWVCPKHERNSVNWENINLYHNDFNEIIAKIAFTGDPSNVNGIVTSPEFTTAGMLKKCWHREADGNIYLYKGSSMRYSNGGQEAYLEAYASQIAKKLELPHVDYDVISFKNQNVSRCKLFTDENIGYLPISALVNNITHRDELSIYKKQLEIGEIYGTANFEDMMVFDALIHNTDRHLNNFGMLIDNNTNKILGAAPLFDHGNSLFFRANDEDYENLKDFKRDNTNYWGITYNQQAKLYLKERHIPMLEKLDGFKFQRFSSDIVDDKKIDALESYIKNRAKEFIKHIKKQMINEKKLPGRKI